MFTITFKTPDIDMQLADAIQNEADADTSAEEIELMQEVFEKFVRNNEYIEIEFDTTNMTARAVPIER
jgi:hypothetical protein